MIKVPLPIRVKLKFMVARIKFRIVNIFRRISAQIPGEYSGWQIFLLLDKFVKTSGKLANPQDISGYILGKISRPRAKNTTAPTHHGVFPNPGCLYVKRLKILRRNCCSRLPPLIPLIEQAPPGAYAAIGAGASRPDRKGKVLAVVGDEAAELDGAAGDEVLLPDGLPHLVHGHQLRH
jgi:hypothetical protein